MFAASLPRSASRQVAAQLRVQPDVARIVSFYEAHDPATVSRNRRSAYVVAYFKPRSERQLQFAARHIEDHFSRQLDARLGG